MTAKEAFENYRKYDKRITETLHTSFEAVAMCDLWEAVKFEAGQTEVREKEIEELQALAKKLFKVALQRDTGVATNKATDRD